METLNNEKKVTTEKITKKDLFLIVIIILFLSGISYWHFKNWKSSLGGFKPPNFEMPKLEFQPEKEGYQEFISLDGKLKVKYPADWTKMDVNFFANLPQGEEVIKSASKILFLAQKFILEKGANAFLIVQELDKKKESGVQEILDEMKKDTETKGGEMEILNLEIKNKEVIFEAKYKRKDSYSLHSKEKMFLDEEKVYLISGTTFEKDWLVFQKEIEEIINFAQLLE